MSDISVRSVSQMLGNCGISEHTYLLYVIEIPAGRLLQQICAPPRLTGHMRRDALDLAEGERFAIAENMIGAGTSLDQSLRFKIIYIYVLDGSAEPQDVIPDGAA